MTSAQYPPWPELRYELASAGMTQAELARHLNVHRSYISNMILGRDALGIRALIAAARVLGISPATLVPRDTDREDLIYIRDRDKK